MYIGIYNLYSDVYIIITQRRLQLRIASCMVSIYQNNYFLMSALIFPKIDYIYNRVRQISIPRIEIRKIKN